ncbi:hypothetical protein H4R18_003277 [Coemansia javaensis]|uniref:Peptidase S8/S53 domain-containing protein n=1 Tax=Coemansia javaensis TaxID=2761396 RepID=A0A9W8LGK4_9FUNG|nr:hypothetical protein H4R18_003277 [Coemansia javaensis]
MCIMKPVMTILVLAAAGLGAGLAQQLARGCVIRHAAHVPVRPNSYIVEFHDGAAGAHIEQIQALPGVTVDHHYWGLFRGMAVTLNDLAHPGRLAEVYGVKAVHPNRIHALDARSGGPGAASTFLHQMTGVQRAHAELQLDGKGIRIGVIDTGVDYTHPDLGACWKTEGCPWQYGQDLVGDKYTVSDENPVIRPNPTPLDQCNGHGTHVAGILMARGSLVHGVAPAATYGMYRVFGCPVNGTEQGTSDDIIIRAMAAAHADGHHIVNLSLGSIGWPGSPMAAFASRLAAAGVVVVAAAGNSGVDGLLTSSVPAVGSGVISVGAVDNWNVTTGRTTTEAKTGGQMNYMSSFGPTPELDLSPHISAPGGNILSTFPTIMGSYSIMSGTSMATPYMSGAAALLKQARPELTVAQAHAALMSTARPIADLATGRATTPLRSGAGLVNVYDSVKSRALVDPPYLAINNTGVYGDNRPVPASFTRTVTITNTDKKSPARVSMASVVANSVTMINPNGTLTAAAMAGLPLDTWPADKSAVPPGTLPGVECSGCDREIAPGASATVSLTITRPTGLEESAHWFYGGFAQFSMQWEDSAQPSKYVVPYAGYNGDYTKLNILAPAAAGLTGIADKNKRLVGDVAGLVVGAGRPAYLRAFLNLPTQRAVATLVGADGKTAGYLPDGGCVDLVSRSSPSTHDAFTATLNGTVLSSCDSAIPTPVAPGKYRVRAAFLRPFGSPARVADYEAWDSGLFSVA